MFILRTIIAAKHGSRGLAYLSTACYVNRLNFRVRNESGCFPAAMAAITDISRGSWSHWHSDNAMILFMSIRSYIKYS
jgi:hypothetical protein